MILIDAVLRHDPATMDELQDVARRLRRWGGAPTVAAALRFADGRSESPGESRLRVLIDNLGLPVPELQAAIVDPTGTFIGRVDFLFRDRRVFVEFDGAVKHGADSGSDVVVAEKWREDRIRELGYIVVRISWADLHHPSRVAERLQRAFARAAAA